MARYRRLFLLPLDFALVALSHLFAYLVRFEWEVPSQQFEPLLVGLGAALLIKPAVFLASGFYRRLWRYASVPDLVHIVKTVSVASLAAALVTLLFLHFNGYSRSVIVLDWVFLNALILGRSLAWRVIREHHYVRRPKGEPVLVVGAGMAGRMLLQEIRNNQALDHHVVGFLDDDPAKVGANINDIPVLGRVSDLRRIARYRGVEKVIIAIPSAPSRLIRNVLHLCQDASLQVQTLPALADILDEKGLTSQIRDVNLEDLLGRDPVRLDVQRIQSFLTGRRILITGAGGSIGGELCRQVARFKPSEIILLEIAETPLHLIHEELRHEFPKQRVSAILADVRDREQMTQVFRQTAPQVVFHAAAYKHVPMMEFHPVAAVKTNVFGTRNLAEAAEAVGAERFVMISTDKAVNPTNVMGASKRAAEMYVQAFNVTSHTEFVTVRFGNVLGSNGSVVPLFQEQIRKGLPLTVTHPDVTRYFMTIPEASQLVLQAGSMGRGGEIFLLDMGEPVRILDLATELIRLSGLKPKEDVEIVFTGLRPGEKLYEELLIDGEGIKPTEHQKIRVASARVTDLREVEHNLDELWFGAERGDNSLAVQKLRELVPEYQPVAGHPPEPEIRVHPAALVS